MIRLRIMRDLPPAHRLLGGFALLAALVGAAGAWAQGISISVGPDRALTYPPNMTVLPDEHTTFVPSSPGSAGLPRLRGSNVAPGVAGTVVLQTFDLQTFTPVPGYTNPVLSPPVASRNATRPTIPSSTRTIPDTGSVLQDPTLPPGNLMVFYEAENHCPGGVNQQPFYAAIGFARSSDNGHTWPAPENGPLGGPDRYAVLRLPAPEPASEPQPAAMGDAIPAAFVDNAYVYVVYVAPPGPGLVGDGRLRVSRAQLGGAGQLSFPSGTTARSTSPDLAVPIPVSFLRADASARRGWDRSAASTRWHCIS